MPLLQLDKCARPLVPMVLALIIGIIVGFYIPGIPLLSSVFVFGVLCVVILYRHRQKAGFLLLAGLSLFGYQSFQPHMIQSKSQYPAHHIVQFIDDRPWQVVGLVDSLVERFPDRTRFVLKVESVSRNHMRHVATGRVRVTAENKLVGVHEGDRITCLAKLREIRNFNTPGVFDYERHMRFRGISASASVAKKDPITTIQPLALSGISRAIVSCRRAVLNSLDNVPSCESRGILKALVAGDRSEISPETQEIFTRIGVAHILSISGLHMGIVATLALFAFRFLLARSEKILLGGWATRGAAIASVVPVLIYGLLAGESPATVRSMVMVLMFLFSMMMGKESDPLNTLAAAAFAILVMTPTALFDISFQLSFSSVLAILYMLHNTSLFARIARNQSSVLFSRFLSFLLVSLIAILATSPIASFYFNQFSLVGLVGNCVMVPLVGSAVVCLGLLFLFLLLLTEAGALWVLKQAMHLVDFSMVLAKPLAGLPFASIYTVTPSLSEIFLYYGAAWALLNLKKERWAIGLLVCILCAGIIDGAYWLNKRFYHKEMRITYLDVGQGNAALLEIPGGECMLIDGGGFFDNRFDVGARVVAPFLWGRKIGRVETLVLTHPHPDHLNGLLFIAKHFDVKQVWMTGDDMPSGVYSEFRKILEEKGIKVVYPQELASPRTIGCVRFEKLYPQSDFSNQADTVKGQDANNRSLVLKVTSGDRSFLFPGDIEQRAERELVAQVGTALKSDVVLVPHHGSKTSSSSRFLDYVAPHVAVVSAGWKNIFRFPHQEVLERYRACGGKIFRTDQHGSVTITTDGKNLVVTPNLPNTSALPSTE